MLISRSQEKLDDVSKAICELYACLFVSFFSACSANADKHVAGHEKWIAKIFVDESYKLL